MSRRRLQFFLRNKSPFWFLGSFLVLGIIAVLIASDYDGDNLEDTWEAQYGYSTNGYAYSNMIIWAQMDHSSQTNVIDRSLNQFTGIVTNFSSYVPGLYSNALSIAAKTTVSFPATQPTFNLVKFFCVCKLVEWSMSWDDLLRLI